ncbi:MAG: hypothetical protein KY393_07710 [Actinobacteria bacterium]|nr:hypothetical protein [Actinomycetota bacterium]
MAWKRKLLALMVASFAIFGVACDDAEEDGGLDNGGGNGTETDNGLGDELGDVGEETGEVGEEVGDETGDAAEEVGDEAQDVTDDSSP